MEVHHLLKRRRQQGPTNAPPPFHSPNRKAKNFKNLLPEAVRRRESLRVGRVRRRQNLDRPPRQFGGLLFLARQEQLLDDFRAGDRVAQPRRLDGCAEAILTGHFDVSSGARGGPKLRLRRGEGPSP
jgi:hypothetical protein